MVQNQREVVNKLIRSSSKHINRSKSKKENLPSKTFLYKVNLLCEVEHMLKIFVTPREILCFLRKSWVENENGDL